MNEVSVSTCCGLIHGGGLIFGGAYSRRFTVIHKTVTYFVPNIWRYLHIDILYTL